jgi:hypothetical protein
MEENKDRKYPGEEAVDRCLGILGEHYDSIQILASYVDDEGENTIRIYKGKGSVFARHGMAHDFLNDDLRHETAKTLAEIINKDSI